MKSLLTKNTYYLLPLAIPIIVGLYLIFTSNTPSQVKLASENVSVTVISLGQEKAPPYKLFLGVALLIFGAGLSYYFLRQILQEKKISKNKELQLTHQEHKIYKLIQSGYSNKEIASELNVSLSTIKTHINNIYKKRAVSSRNELLKT